MPWESPSRRELTGPNKCFIESNGYHSLESINSPRVLKLSCLICKIHKLKQFYLIIKVNLATAGILAQLTASLAGST